MIEAEKLFKKDLAPERFSRALSFKIRKRAKELAQENGTSFGQAFSIEIDKFSPTIVKLVEALDYYADRKGDGGVARKYLRETLDFLESDRSYEQKNK